MREFRNKVAVITGAGSGIGFAIAERCLQEGMRVALADIEESALANAEKMLTARGGTVRSILTDVSKVKDVENLAQQTLGAFGAVHLLCNNAGVVAGGSIWESSLADWEWVMNVNLWGVIHGIRVFVPIMLSQDTECHVINTASMAALLPSHSSASYHVTKHAVLALSEHLYQTLALRGSKMKVSVLCPGFVKTRIMSAVRNRPAELRGETSEPTMSPEDEEARWASAQDNFKVISPLQLADSVFNAIKEDRFYIFTDDSKFNEMVKKRMEDILEGRNPTVQDLSFLMNPKQ